MSGREAKPRRYLPLYPAQAEFLDSPALFRGFVGGRGAGKSFIGGYDLLRRARRGRLYMAVAPTYPMLRDATLRGFLSVASTLGVPVHLNKSDMTASIPSAGVEVLFRSADDPERLRGPNLSGCWVDEASLTHRDTYDIAIATLREKGEQGWLSATFTPKGKRHWTYEVFGTGAPDTSLTHARTGDNPFLPESFERTVRQQYTASFAAQELGGEFVDAAGLLFKIAAFPPPVTAAPVHARRVRYWDKAGTAGGGDYSAGVLVARTPDGRYFVEHVARGRWSAGERNAVIRTTAAADHARYRGAGGVGVWVEQEPGSGGKESAEISVRELAGYNVRAERVTGEKVGRAMPFAAQVEAGNVWLVEGAWNRDYLDELSTFPGGTHDDQVDASAGAFNKLAAAGGSGDGPQTGDPDTDTVHGQTADAFT